KSNYSLVCFSSRRRHTRFSRDWSSDVCSSDLDAYHKGEFNPREKVIVFSWKDFENGYKIENDNLNIGIHEFTHAMQLEAKQARDLDSARFSKHFQFILKRLTHQEVKDQLDKTKYFRA